MRHTVSLTKNSDFGRLYKKGGCAVSGIIVIYYKKNGTDGCRLGITVSKKIGKAVVRNHVKRLIREAYYRLEPGITGYDMVIVARTRATTTAFNDLLACMKKLFSKSGMLKI